ncbi:MAG: hypothetical protein ACP5VQ_10535, partial [Phycisphaerae bacterium]
MADISRRDLIATAIIAGAALGGGADSGAAPVPAARLPRGAPASARAKTLFGIGYETWFLPTAPAGGWGTAEARPVLGNYSSLDPKVIRQHAYWIHDAGIDFILIDWSNNLLGGNWSNGSAKGIIDSTLRLLAEYTHLKRHPKFALLLGLDAKGGVSTAEFHAQMLRIEQEILAKPEYAMLWQQFDGKPLLAIFLGGVLFTPPPAYSNAHFTVRWFGMDHESTFNNYGTWSWGDRMPIVNGPATPIFPFQGNNLQPWKAGPGWSLTHKPLPSFGGCMPDMGAYAATQAGGPGGSLVSPPFTVTDRVITFNYSGVNWWTFARLQFPGGKVPPTENVFVLRDAVTGEILRRAFPPGMALVTMRQWDVADLMGRRVIFEAMASPPVSLPVSQWLAFGGLAFTHSEQMAASVAVEGAEAGGGAWSNYDAHRRCSGATLVSFMDAAFRYEPEVVMIQQWNEFTAPDMYSVADSDDIEPTVIHRLEGPYSEGWGFYYLDLVTKLIRQYRQGFR